jgi:mercuric ion transport protein
VQRKAKEKLKCVEAKTQDLQALARALDSVLPGRSADGSLSDSQKLGKGKERAGREQNKEVTSMCPCEEAPKPRLLKSSVTTLSFAGLSAALLASVCCIGPLVFAALGVGIGATGFLAGAAGFLTGLLPYRPAFIGLTILLLGIGLYLTYGKPQSAVSAPEVDCAPGTRSGMNRAWFWLTVTFAMVLILMPYWLGL